MDGTKVWEETYRILRQIATAAAGFFASSAITTPFIDAKWDLLISIICGAIGYGTSRQSDGLSVIPGVKKAAPLLLLALLLGYGVVALAPIGLTGCGMGQRVRTHVEVPALVYILPAIQEDANFGITLAPEEDRDALLADLTAFTEAIRSKDRTRIASEAYPRWPLIRALAQGGIAAQVQNGTLSEDAARMGREHVDQCGGMLDQLALP